MIPIRDAARSAHFPLINWLLIVANSLAFFWQLSLGPRLQEAVFLYGIVPMRYSDPVAAAHFTLLEQVLPFFTSMFLHGGWLHILGNMWFLYIFGDNIEDRLGSIRYLFFYLLCGIAAGLIHLITNWHSRLPTIGASGAIAGVMGAYVLLFPRARILTLVPIFFFVQFFEIPAFIFLGYWFLIQLLSAGLTPSEMGGVAWWAHIGGFVAGAVLVKLFDRLPQSGVSKRISQYTERHRSPRLQPVFPWTSEDDLHSYGVIHITPREAYFGTKKLVHVPYEGRRRTILVTVPPGMEEGKMLRLAGLGKRDEEGNRGDLFLEVRIG